MAASIPGYPKGGKPLPMVKPPKKRMNQKPLKGIVKPPKGVTRPIRKS